MPLRKITIAFDCDETLWLNFDYAYGKPNMKMVRLYNILESLPNTEMYVWSHGGEEWAEEVAQTCGLKNYTIIKKPFPVPKDKSNAPDIAFDDMDDMGKTTIFVDDTMFKCNESLA